MSNRGLDALRHALGGDPGPHLDEETMAEIAADEAAGMDVETIYASQIQHLELCVECAEAYGELLTLMSEAVAGMATAARATSPEEVYATLLQQELAAAGVAAPDLQQVAHAVAVALPALFTSSPLPADVASDELVTALATILTSQEQHAERDPRLLPALTAAIEENLAALSLYLESLTRSVWGRATEVSQSAAGRWQEIRLALQPQKQMALLGGSESGADWPLFRQQVGHPLPLIVEASAHRLSPLACRLLVRVDRPGLSDPSGRPARVTYFNLELTAETDENGLARFAPIPIAALPHLSIYIQA